MDLNHCTLVLALHSLENVLYIYLMNISDSAGLDGIVRQYRAGADI